MEYRRWQLQIAITVSHAPGPDSAAIVERPLISDLTTITLQCVLLQLSCIRKERVHSEMDRQEIWGLAVFSLNLNSMLPCRAE